MTSEHASNKGDQNGRHKTSTGGGKMRSIHLLFCGRRQMRIVRGVSSSGFTRVPNAAIRDAQLSYRARGIYAFLLSHIDEGWLSDATFLSRHGKEGRDACEKALRELAECGYIERKKRQLLTGRWTTDVIVYESPGPDRLTDAATRPSDAPEDVEGLFRESEVTPGPSGASAAPSASRRGAAGGPAGANGSHARSGAGAVDNPGEAAGGTEP